MASFSRPQVRTYHDPKGNNYSRSQGRGKKQHFNSKSKIPFFQLNTRKGRPSTDFIVQKCSDNKNFIAMISEVHVSNENKKPVGYDRQHQLFYGGEKPRALIYASKSLSLWEKNDLCDRDTAVCLWKTHPNQNNSKTTVLVSSYWDIKHPSTLSTTPKPMTWI